MTKFYEFKFENFRGRIKISPNFKEINYNLVKIIFDMVKKKKDIILNKENELSFTLLQKPTHLNNIYLNKI